MALVLSERVGRVSELRELLEKEAGDYDDGLALEATLAFFVQRMAC